MNKKMLVLSTILLIVFTVYFIFQINYREIFGDNYNNIVINLDMNSVVDQCIYKDNLYYIKNTTEKISIVSGNIYNNRTNTIYEYENDQNNLFLNEIFASEKSLTWVVNYKNNSSWEIVVYDLKENKINTLRRFEESNNSIVSPCLSMNGSFISWYEATEMDNSIKAFLIVYDTVKNKIIKFDENIYLNNPYTRGFMIYNYISFCTKNDGKYQIIIYNLNNNIKKIVEINSEATRILSNGKYTIWMDNYDDKNIYIYNHENGEYSEIKGTPYLFTINLKENILYLSYVSSEIEPSNIYAFNLDVKELKNITYNDSTEKIFYLSKLCDDDKITYETKENGNIYYNIKVDLNKKEAR